MIITDSLRKAYGDTAVVDNVNVKIPRGGVTSIIGPNGAGKSTLLGIIARLLDADGGRVTVGDLDTSLAKADELARTMAILRQDNQIAVRLTVRELVEFGRFPYSKGRLQADDRAAVASALDQLGLRDLQSRFLDQLSGGQRQRAFVAMVLAQETDYILLDEPLNNLDIQHAIGMMTLVGTLAHQLNKTVVVVIHDINFAAAYSDAIIAMKNGQVIAHDTPEELLTTEKLEEIYGLRMLVETIRGRKVALYFDHDAEPLPAGE